MRSLHVWYLWRMPEMDAPRALVFRPLVKGNEALGTRLLRVLNFKLSDRAPPDKIALAEGGTVLFEIRSKDTEFLEWFSLFSF